MILFLHPDTADPKLLLLLFLFLLLLLLLLLRLRWCDKLCFPYVLPLAPGGYTKRLYIENLAKLPEFENLAKLPEFNLPSAVQRNFPRFLTPATAFVLALKSHLVVVGEECRVSSKLQQCGTRNENYGRDFT